jgi:hypothetical protein
MHALSTPSFTLQFMISQNVEIFVNNDCFADFVLKFIDKFDTMIRKALFEYFGFSYRHVIVGNF